MTDGLRERVLAFVRGLDIDSVENVERDTSLLDSGLLDSLALFHLAQWVETELGEPIDPLEVDLTEEWETVDRIVRYLEVRRSTIDRHAPT